MDTLRRLVQKFRDITLKQKLFLCIICFIIVPLLAAGIFINSFITELITEKACETSLLNLKQTHQGFINLENEIDDFSLEILSDDRVQLLLRKYSTGEKDVESIKVELVRWFKKKLELKTYIDSVCLISDNNNIILQSGSTVAADNESFIIKAYKLEGKGFWTYAYYPESFVDNYKYIISFYRVVNDFDKRGRPLGVERISVSEEAICNLYKGISTYNEGKMLLVDSSGRVVSSPDKQMINEELGHYSYIKSVLENKEGFFTCEINGESQVVLFYSIEPLGWQLIHILPAKMFNPVKNTVNVIIFITVILCLLFGLLFSVVLNSFVLKPLKLLFNEVAKVASGDFSMNLSVKSNDEIGKISKGVKKLVNDLKELIENLYISKINQREAELKALESQINPHFLYNTLDSIHWLALKNKDYEVSEQIEALSEIFKHVLNTGKSMVTIRDEIDFLENYMVIQRARFGDRIKISIEADDSLFEYETPKLVIQPIVENSIVHGFEEKMGCGQITISIKKQRNNIVYTMIDDGLGTNQEKIRSMMNSKEQSHNVFALKNIDERIKIKYGNEYGMSFYSEEGKGTKVEIIIPARRRID